ncbi:MAG TPA: hypothetical protein VES42_09720, partial [Pilimelia sp.]|nr:hypothetical protein [Pilimelia sp.]
LAGAAAALGTPVVALAGTAAAVLWVGAGPPGRDRGWWWLPALAGVVAPPEYRSPATPDRAVIADVVPLIAGTLVMIAVVWLAYAARLALPARAGAVEAVPAPAYPASASALTRSGWWPRLALAGGVFAVVAWAVVLTYLTPNIGIPTPWPAEAPDLVAGWRDWNTHEGRLWMHELRLFAILSAALCLLLAGAFRGAPLLPAIGGTAVLLAVDTAVAGAGLASLRALPSVVVAGLAVGAAAWWAALRLGERDRRGDDHRRRLVAGVTLFTVVVAPGIHLHRIVPVPGVQTPPSVLLVAVGLPAVLLALAGLGMAGTAARPFGRGAAYGLPIGLGGAALAGGLLLWRDGVPQIAGFWAIALTGPLVTLTVVVIRGGLPAGQLTGLRSVTVLVALASMPVAVVVGFLSILVSMFSADEVLAPIGYHLGFDGLPYVPGAVVVGIVASLLLTARLKGQPARPTFDTVTPPPGPAASGPAASGPAAVGVATPQ